MTTYRPHNDPIYRAAKAELKRNPQPCWECGKPATTPDHDPPIAKHQHLRGSGCCTLRPHCRTCSNRQGGLLATTDSDTVAQRTPVARWFG